MVEIRIIYEGELRCTSTHQPSATQLTTDAPKDNHGKGESFSPTDLVAAALGSCILTVMGIAARGMDIDLTGAKVVVQKEMVFQPTRRIGKLSVNIDIPGQLNQVQKTKVNRHSSYVPGASKSAS